MRFSTPPCVQLATLIPSNSTFISENKVKCWSFSLRNCLRSCVTLSQVHIFSSTPCFLYRAALEMGRYMPACRTRTSFCSWISYRHLSIYTTSTQKKIPSHNFWPSGQNYAGFGFLSFVWMPPL
jgi:hypothetical protein